MSRWTLATRTAAIDAIFGRAPVVPVLTIERIDDAVPLARALVAGGLPVLEVTLRTPCALDAIRRIAAEVPGAAVGAGTVLTPALYLEAVAANAQFAIAPGATGALYDAADESTIPFLPAVASASEIMFGIDRGYARFKFFPAAPLGGAAALKAFAGPFAGVKFCPTGGLDAASAKTLLALPNVVTVGGSWMLPNEALAARDWSRIESLAREAAALR